MAYLIDEKLPDHIIVEQIDDLNRKLIDTEEKTITYETLYKTHKFHEYYIWLTNKLDGPAEIHYFDDFKTINREIYYYKGSIHKIDGPAWVSYFQDGEICYERYLVDNVSCDNELQFLVAIENFKNKEEEFFLE